MKENLLNPWLDVVNLPGVQVRDEVENIKYGPDHKCPTVHIKKFVLYFLVTVAF